MSNVDKTITKRRLAKKQLVKGEPDYDIEAWITGVRVGSDDVLWDIQIEGEDDYELAAGILERAAEVLRDKD